MGTLDNRGGSPISPPDDLGADPSETVESILTILEAAKIPTPICDQVVKLIEDAEIAIAETEFLA